MQDSKHHRTKPKKCHVGSTTRRELDKLWSSVFPDAGRLVKEVVKDGADQDKRDVQPIAPSVYTLSHTLKQAHGHGWTDTFQFTINGLVVRSPLGMDAFFSTECSSGKYVNLYTVILPDIPGVDGDISTSQYYINLLAEEGLNVSGIMFKWSGASTKPPVQGRILNIRHQNIGLDPLEFSRKTIKALKLTISLINKRVATSESTSW